MFLSSIFKEEGVAHNVERYVVFDQKVVHSVNSNSTIKRVVDGAPPEIQVINTMKSQI